MPFLKNEITSPKTKNARPKLQLLSMEQIELVHNLSIQILEKTGIKVKKQNTKIEKHMRVVLLLKVLLKKHVQRKKKRAKQFQRLKWLEKKFICRFSRDGFGRPFLFWL